MDLSRDPHCGGPPFLMLEFGSIWFKWSSIEKPKHQESSSDGERHMSGLPRRGGLHFYLLSLDLQI